MKLSDRPVARRVLVAALLAAPILAAPGRDALDILKKVDDLYRSGSSRARFEMEIITPHWRRTLRIDAWSQGSEKTFLRILEPRKERGMATLRLGSEMWNFLPKTNKVLKIPPSMMMGSWMGSDFTNDDLVKEYTFIRDYDFALAEIGDPVPGQIYIRCVPKPDRPIVWGHVLIAVRQGDHLPLWERFYDEKGGLMREMIFSEIRPLGGRLLPSVMEIVSTARKGNRTILRYLEAEFDLDIPAETFSLRNLRAGI